MDFIHSILPHSDEIFQILLILMVVIWSTGRLFHRLKLPAVLGEILAGILIGPSVLGLIPTDNEVIKVLSELGVFFLMFHAGLDTDPRKIFPRLKISIFTAIGGMIPIFVGVLAIAYFSLIPMLPALFLAMVLSINSIPVIISILKNFKLHDTKIGHIVMGSSVANEIILFVVLSVLLSVAEVGSFQPLLLLWIMIKVLLFFVGTLFLGKAILPFFAPFLNRSGMKGFTFALIVALIFGLFADAIGLSVVLGAYLGGMFVREEISDEKQFSKIEDRVFGISYSFLGPIFFASVGMMVSLSALSSHFILVILLVLLVIVGQVSGSGLILSAFSQRVPIKKALKIGIGLLGRGGTEIIVAGIGYQTVIHGINGESSRLLPAELYSVVVVVVFLVTLAMPFLLKTAVKIKEKDV